MNKYIPFLKAKVGEVGGLAELDNTVKKSLSVLLDLARLPPDKSEKDYTKHLKRISNSAIKKLKQLKSIYLDVLDIPSEISGKTGFYSNVLNEFNGLKIIPVVSVDRTSIHNKEAIQYNSDILAIRVLPNDFESFEIFNAEFQELCDTKFENQQFDIIFDCRTVPDLKVSTLSDQIVSFRKKIGQTFRIRRTVIAGSTIPSSISDVMKTNESISISRQEMEVFKNCNSRLNLNNLYFADYGISSAIFTDVSISPNLWQSVIAPKIFYSHENVFFIERGGALKQSRDGLGQYNEILGNLTKSQIFRGKNFSWGDHFFQSKADGEGNYVTPSSIIKPSVNAHVTYMKKINWNKIF